jgi:tRNA (guanine10-N2)-methyltransferase
VRYVFAQVGILRARRREGFIPPKKPYSFEALMDDVLEFASVMLVENGRLAMWMPTANDGDIELAIPTHDWLDLVSVCIQPFNKCKIHQTLKRNTHLTITGSRRLLVYRRRSEGEIDRTLEKKQKQYGTGKHADELNLFRKKVFARA